VQAQGHFTQKTCQEAAADFVGSRLLVPHRAKMLLESLTTIRVHFTD